AALSANANIAARAREYKQAKLDGSMDQLRVLAYLDILNGVPACDRIAAARAEADAQAQAQAGPRPGATLPAGPGDAGIHGAPGSGDAAAGGGPGARDSGASGDDDADGPAGDDGSPRDDQAT